MAKAKIGRPSGYSPDIVKKAERYLEEAVDTFDQKRRNGIAVKLPSIAGLALYLGVSRQNIYNWADEHPDFFDILQKILAEQEQRLLENGLSGDYNAAIAKLALGKHGYKEHSETDITTKGEAITPLTNEDREAIGELRDLLKQRNTR